MHDDERIPPRYAGQTWGDSRFPPMVEGGSVTDAFLEFQAHQGVQIRRNHPEYYCRVCRWRFRPHTSKGATCGPCKAKASVPTPMDL